MSAIAKYANPELTNLPLIHQGKTRDTFRAQWSKYERYQSGLWRLMLPRLIVATKRLSTHNVVHKSIIPYKDEVLTALTIFWLVDILGKSGIPHHLIAYGREIHDYLPGKPSDYPADLHHRAVVVKALDMYLAEFILRKYLAGSLWRLLRDGKRNPYGRLARDPILMMPFRAPLFTPTDKSETDDPQRASMVRAKYPQGVAIFREAYRLMRQHTNRVGIEVVDCKGEGGKDERGQFVIAERGKRQNVCGITDLGSRLRFHRLSLHACPQPT
ncbi:hypothetical protein HYS79_01695 [Patescibacteria group bacterium]|nr:hypothetical protein [Patescibacteria group bacterium]